MARSEMAAMVQRAVGVAVVVVPAASAACCLTSAEREQQSQRAAQSDVLGISTRLAKFVTSCLLTTAHTGVLRLNLRGGNSGGFGCHGR